MENHRIDKEALRFVWLKAFVIAVNEDSFSEAARQIGVNQSTVSHYLNKLQRWIGRPLLSKDIPRQLTHDGELFMVVAERVIADLERYYVSLSAVPDYHVPTLGTDVQLP